MRVASAGVPHEVGPKTHALNCLLGFHVPKRLHLDNDLSPPVSQNVLKLLSLFCLHDRVLLASALDR
jgi:hypothetical protein